MHTPVRKISGYRDDGFGRGWLYRVCVGINRGAIDWRPVCCRRPGYGLADTSLSPAPIVMTAGRLKMAASMR